MKAQNESTHELLRAKAVATLLCCSVATVWRKAKTDDFPKPLKISAGMTVWRKQEIIDWVNKSAEAANG